MMDMKSINYGMIMQFVSNVYRLTLIPFFTVATPFPRSTAFPPPTAMTKSQCFISFAASHTLWIPSQLYVIHSNKIYLHWWPIGINEYSILCFCNDDSTIGLIPFPLTYLLRQNAWFHLAKQEQYRIFPSWVEKWNKYSLQGTEEHLKIIRK